MLFILLFARLILQVFGYVAKPMDLILGIVTPGDR